MTDLSGMFADRKKGGAIAPSLTVAAAQPAAVPVAPAKPAAPVPVATANGVTVTHIEGKAAPFQVLTREQWIAWQTMENPPVAISNITVRRDLEPRHFLMIGTPGSGKSQAIRSIAWVARRRENPAIVADLGAELIQYFYREGEDIILNPMDARGIGWCPLNEIRKATDYRMMANRLIAETDQNADWTESTRSFVADVLHAIRKHGKPFCTNATLLYFLTKAPYRGSNPEKPSLEWLLQAEPSARYFEGSGGDDEALRIITSIIARNIEPLTYLKEGDFSIRDYVKNFEKSGVEKRWLFMSYTDENYEALSPLIAMWFEIAVQAGLSLNESSERCFWFFLDELATLNKMPAVKSGLEKLRKRGGRMVAGIQSTGQLQEKYGVHGAQVLFSCFGHLLMLRVSDDETAEKLSRIMGDAIIKSKSNTNGTSTNSVTTSDVVRRRILPVEFTTYPDMNGWFRPAGSRHAIQIGPKPDDTPGEKLSVMELPLTIMPRVAESEVSRMEMDIDYLESVGAQAEGTFAEG
jgi:hypothetical protein